MLDENNKNEENKIEFKVLETTPEEHDDFLGLESKAEEQGEQENESKFLTDENKEMLKEKLSEAKDITIAVSTVVAETAKENFIIYFPILKSKFKHFLGNINHYLERASNYKAYAEFDAYVKENLVDNSEPLQDTVNRLTGMIDSKPTKKVKEGKVTETVKEKEKRLAKEEQEALQAEQIKKAKMIAVGILVFVELFAIITPFSRTHQEWVYSFSNLVFFLNLVALVGYYVFRYFQAGSSYTIFNSFDKYLEKQNMSNNDIISNMYRLVDYIADLQKTLPVRVDLSKPINLNHPQSDLIQDSVAESLGLPLSEAYMVYAKITNSNDYKVANHWILPVADTRRVNYYSSDMIYISLIDLMLDNVGYTRSSVKLPTFPSILKKLDTNFVLEDRKRDKLRQDRRKAGFTRESLDILEYLEDPATVEVLGMKPDTNIKNSVITDFYFKVKMDLIATTQEKLKPMLETIGLKTGIKPKMMEGSNFSNVILKFSFKKPLEEKNPYPYSDIKSLAVEHGAVNVGASYDGDLILKFPRKQTAGHVLIAGGTGTGKSAFAQRFETSNLLVTEPDGDFMFEDLFIYSAKAFEDWGAFTDRGARGRSTPKEIYEDLIKIHEYMNVKIPNQFKKVGAEHIADFNKKSKKHKQSHTLIIFDEYQNTLADAKNENYEIITTNKQGEEVSKMVSLDKLIANQISLMLRLHRSRGLQIHIITQDITMDSLGDMRRQLANKFIAWVDKNSWDSLDTSREISKNNTTVADPMGRFYVEAPNFKKYDPLMEYDTIGGGFIETQTHFTDGDIIREQLDRTFRTEKLMEAGIISSNTFRGEFDYEKEMIRKKGQSISNTPATPTPTVVSLDTEEETTTLEEQSLQPKQPEVLEPVVSVDIEQAVESTNDTQSLDLNNLLSLDSEETEELVEEQEEQSENYSSDDLFRQMLENDLDI